MVNWPSDRFYQLAEETFPFIQKTTQLAAATLYLTSTLVAASAKSDQSAVTLARLILYNSVVLLLMAKTVQVLKSWQLQTKFTLCIFFVEFIGYCNLGLAAIAQEFYNRGAWYMVASFLISIAQQMSIVLLLVPKNQIRQKRYHFLSSLNSCCSALLFFFGALVSNFWSEELQRHLISSSLNVISGIILCMSVFYNLKAEHYKDYVNMPIGTGE